MSDVVRESAAVYGPTPRRMTLAEYYRAAEKGVFRPDERLELIHGEVFQKASPQRSTHSVAISLVSKALVSAFGSGHYVHVQMPLALSDANEPEPDVAVVVGEELDYVKGHPSAGDVRLVVEVSDTTLKFGRGVKAQLYAEFGIQEYWIVNLKDRKLEVLRKPEAGCYAESIVLDRSHSVHPVSANSRSIKVSDLIPVH